MFKILLIPLIPLFFLSFFIPRTIIITLPKIPPEIFTEIRTETRIITAYNPVKSQTDHTPCISASGLNICKTDKLICACPRKYPFGTKFLINGQVWECQDRLNKKFDDRIDLLMRDFKEAKNFGKQIAEIIIIN